MLLERWGEARVCSDHTTKSCLQIEHKSVFFFPFLLFKHNIFLLDEAAGFGFEQFYKWFKSTTAKIS